MLNKVLSTFSIKVIIALLNFFFTVALSRYLGAHGKGEVSIIIASVTVVLIFCDIVGGGSLLYFVPRYNKVQLILISNAWSIIICGLLWAFFNSMQLLTEAPITHIIVISLMSSLLTTNLSIILAKEKINTNNIMALLKAGIHFVGFLVLVYFTGHKNATVYIYSFYISLLFCIFLSSILVYPYLRDFLPPANNKKLITELSKFGLYNQAGHIMKFISVRLCFYLITYYSGNAALGVFSNAASLIEVILIITNSFTTILYPRIVNTVNKKAAQKLTIKYNRLSSIACFIAIIPLLLLPSSCYTWLFGPDFKNMREIITIQAPGILLYNTALVMGYYFSGTGKYYVNTIANLTGLLIAILISLIVIPNYTNFWASIISSCSYSATFVVILFYFKKESNVTIKQLIPGLSDLRYIKLLSKSVVKRWI